MQGYWRSFRNQLRRALIAEVQREIRLKPNVTNEKPKGPASYFPSIEKKYERPIEHWLAIIRDLGGMKHMEMVNHLKTEHGMGHGHANAIVAFVRDESSR